MYIGINQNNMNKAITNAQKSIVNKIYIPKRARENIKVVATRNGLKIESTQKRD